MKVGFRKIQRKWFTHLKLPLECGTNTKKSPKTIHRIFDKVWKSLKEKFHIPLTER